MGQDGTVFFGEERLYGHYGLMIRTYIKKSERRIANRETVIQAVREVIIDKYDKIDY